MTANINDNSPPICKENIIINQCVERAKILNFAPLQRLISKTVEEIAYEKNIESSEKQYKTEMAKKSLKNLIEKSALHDMALALTSSFSKSAMHLDKLRYHEIKTIIGV